MCGKMFAGGNGPHTVDDLHRMRAEIRYLMGGVDANFGSHCSQLDAAATPKDSGEGRQKQREADEFKRRGNQSLCSGHLMQALALYASAIQCAIVVKDNMEQLAVLYSNASYAWAQLSEFDSAALNAGLCLYCNPRWYKAHLRMLQVHTGMGNHGPALEHARSLCDSSDVPEGDRHNMLLHLVRCASKITGGYHVFDNKQVDDDIWRVVIATLVENKEWHNIRVLFGLDRNPPVVTSQVANDVKLYTIVESCSYDDWQHWGEKMTLLLMKKGAKCDTLSKDSKFPLHAALSVSRKFRSQAVLAELLNQVSEVMIHSKDDKGCNVLHVACVGDYPTKPVLVKFLLDHGLDPGTRNDAGQTAADLLPPHDPLRETLAPYLRKSGSNSFPHDPILHEGRDPDTQAGRSPIDLDLDRQAGRSPIQSWDQNDIQTWLSHNGLTSVSDRFKDMDGKHIRELQIFQQTAPKFYLRAAQNHLGLTLAQILTLSDILRKA